MASHWAAEDTEAKILTLEGELGVLTFPLGNLLQRSGSAGELHKREGKSHSRCNEDLRGQGGIGPGAGMFCHGGGGGLESLLRSFPTNPTLPSFYLPRFPEISHPGFGFPVNAAASFSSKGLSKRNAPKRWD